MIRSPYSSARRPGFMPEQLLVLLAVLSALAATALLPACSGKPGSDLVETRKIVTESRSDPVFLPGQRIPAVVDTLTFWLGPDIARRDAGDQTFLIDAVRRELTLVDHTNRTWTRQTTDQVHALLRFLAADTLDTVVEDAHLGSFKTMLRVAARVTETDEEAVIDGYRCRRWLVEQELGDQRISSELWLSGDIDLDHGLLHQATRPALLALPGGEEAIGELSRLQGVPVRTSSLIDVLGRRSKAETRLLSIETVRLPRSFFRPPPFYSHDN